MEGRLVNVVGDLVGAHNWHAVAFAELLELVAKESDALGSGSGVGWPGIKTMALGALNEQTVLSPEQGGNGVDHDQTHIVADRQQVWDAVVDDVPQGIETPGVLEKDVGPNILFIWVMPFSNANTRQTNLADERRKAPLERRGKLLQPVVGK
jgi:hypothetical protein